MADLTDEDIDAALVRGDIASIGRPRATAARFDATSGRIVVDLSNGCTFAFPTSAAQGLATATRAQLAAVEILGAGFGLHWDALDIDLSISGLLAGIFGTASYMAGRAGRISTPAKAAAARANGAKGGRPRKSAAP
jgi:hypothetical protein